MSPLLRFAQKLAILLAALAPLLASADPPARVGRLSLIEGSVTFRTDRQDAGAPATSNWPISSGAILDTDRSGRAEIWIGSTAFRLDGGSRAEFATVDDQRVALQMAQGSLAITVRDRDQADGIDINTPAGQVRFGAPGRYRIDVDEGSGDTQVASRDGSAYIYRSGGELSVSSGQQAVAYARGGWFVVEARPDAFDAWADTRDSVAHAPTARRYVSPNMTGYEDLDRYGSWNSSPEYGTVWYPSAIPAGWAPYRYGRWAWIPPWGWTWVDEAPWGFAPFHYGRWVLIGAQWAWVPGVYTPRPVYAPALVAWVGTPGWSVSFGFGSSPAVGWFPLAPREVFVPAYHCSPTYVRQVNVTHVTNVTVIEQVVAGRHKPVFANRNLAQAVTVVPAATVQSGNPITPTVLHQSDRHDFAHAPVAARAPGTAWLPPAATALRPHPEDAALSRLAPPRHPDSQPPKPVTSAGDPAPTASPHTPSPVTSERRAWPPAATPAPQPTPSTPKAATIQSFPPPLRHDNERPEPVRRFNAPPEAATQSPRAPLPAPAVIPNGTPEAQPKPLHTLPAPEPRTAVLPPSQPHSAVVSPAPASHEAPRAPEMPHSEAALPQREIRHPGRPEFEHPVAERQAAPPAAAPVQPPSPSRQWAPAMPAAQPPVTREATPHPMPATPRIEAPNTARQAQSGESHERRHEHGKAPNGPQ